MSKIYENSFSTSLPSASILASPTKFAAAMSQQRTLQGSPDSRKAPYKAKRPSKKLFEFNNNITSSNNNNITHSIKSTSNGIAINGHHSKRPSYGSIGGRPSSVDIDSLYEDDSEMDLMTRFNSDVRRAQNKNSHKSRSRFGRGLAKKNGAGGHFTWGVAGSELDEQELSSSLINSDPLDPNYDSDCEENCKFETIMPPLDDDEVEKYLTPILQEYFEHGDTNEVFGILSEVNLSGNYHQILTTLISLAMDRKSSHRESASLLISDLFDKLLTSEDIEHGFDTLLRQLDDLELDTPNASVVLGNFIARAVADDCLPPRYVTSTKEILESKGKTANLSKAETLALKAIEHANTLINAKRGLIRLDSVWGQAGGAKPVKYLVKRMRLLLKEYLLSLDVVEAERCLRELEVPHFFHEFVYEAILMAIEDVKKQDDLVAIAKLLKSLTDINLISVEQLKKGFTRLFSEMSDIQIDVPHAYSTLEKFMQSCFSVKLFLPRGIVEHVPSRGRKRFISENNDGGRIKA